MADDARQTTDYERKRKRNKESERERIDPETSFRRFRRAKRTKQEDDAIHHHPKKRVSVYLHLFSFSLFFFLFNNKTNEK